MKKFHFCFNFQNKSVLEFFGCNKSRDNRLEDIIRSQISDQDLNQWSVHMVEETTGPKEETTVPSINQSQQELGSDTDLLSYNDSAVHQTIPEITDSIDRKTGRRAVLSPDPRRPSYTENPKYYQTSYQRPEQRVQQNFEQKPDSIPRVVRVITGQLPYQWSDHSSLEPTPQKSDKISNSGHNIDGSEVAIPDHTIQTEDETQIVSKELSNIWKIFPIILMFSLLLIAICILMFGFFAVFSKSYNE